MKSELKLHHVSSLCKVISLDNLPREIKSARVLGGEHFSYQIVMEDTGVVPVQRTFRLTVESELSPYIKLYVVKNVLVDMPKRRDADNQYLFNTPAYVPDILVPIEEQNGLVTYVSGFGTLWVEVSVPHNMRAGKYPVKIDFHGLDVIESQNYTDSHYVESSVFDIEVLSASLPKQELKYTQWFHVDCIASAHNVDIYSEAHWALIENYMSLAVKLGINMILTPVITPPLDTAPGHKRPVVQLVDIEWDGEKYSFNFARLHRYIDIAKKCGIKYYEISHLFTQWGCRYTPHIVVKENGVEVSKFGWHVSSDSPEYAEFLKALIPALINELRELGVIDYTYFHISDEPHDAIETYEYVSSLLRPLLSGYKTMDALSRLDFYKKGLVGTPVCPTNVIEPFIEANVPGLWAYYCSSQHTAVSNRFMAMSALKNRIIGLQLYKYGIEGFLHWGYNFYYSKFSLYEINPYITSSADGIFSSGDTYSVYPIKSGAAPSVRAFVFREALEDILLCRLLEEKIGKVAVVKLIEDTAGMEITFKEYPKDDVFFDKLTKKIKDMLA